MNASDVAEIAKAIEISFLGGIGLCFAFSFLSLFFGISIGAAIERGKK